MKLREIDTSGPTSLVTVVSETGGSEFMRLFLRPDGVVVALPMSSQGIVEKKENS